TTLWKEQIRLIRERHGLISFITHPDYLVGGRERAVYVDLLHDLSGLRARHGVWITLPGDINRWWRNRSRMKLVRDRDAWHIEGPDSHRAQVAYATIENGRLTYKLDVVGKSGQKARVAARA